MSVHGWLKIQDEWQRVATGETFADCHKRLLLEAERRGVQSALDRMMTGGRNPGDIRRRTEGGKERH
jgi:hypothetical protein